MTIDALIAQATGLALVHLDDAPPGLIHDLQAIRGVCHAIGVYAAVLCVSGDRQQAIDSASDYYADNALGAWSYIIEKGEGVAGVLDRMGGSGC